MLTPETVTLEFPVLVNFTGSVVLSPTVSLPKFRLDVEGTSVWVDPEPEPLKATVTSAAPLLFFRVKVPEALPDVVGLNPTAK